MPRHVALLRAINVPGHVVRMEELRRILEAAGLRNVETFIGSGNVIFDSSVRDAGRVERRMEAALAAALGYDVATFVRTTDDIAAIAARDPFRERAGDPPRPLKATLFVGFLGAPPGRAARLRVAAHASANDAFHVRGREVFWLCRARSMESIALMGKIEKALGVPVTFRNMNTIRRLATK